MNLGTPEAPTTQALKPYLRQFLMDPYVIDIPYWKRWLLINLIIVPFRSPKSAQAYQRVWTDEGSPLLVISQKLKNKLQQNMGEDYVVELGMRYGKPSTQLALEKLTQSHVDSIVAIPLYPHYAESSSRTALEELKAAQAKLNCQLPIRYIDEFYAHPDYLTAKRNLIKNELADFNADYLLFSYHGIPERHILKVNQSCEACLADLTCGQRNVNKRCYRGQCFRSTELLVKDLNIPHTTSFQSRLGRDPWIKPYTDHVLEDLAKQGVKRLAVACPAFTADCLETLEEIAMEGKAEFIKAGGEDLKLIPALNDNDLWVESLAKIIKEIEGSGEVLT